MQQQSMRHGVKRFRKIKQNRYRKSRPLHPRWILSIILVKSSSSTTELMKPRLIGRKQAARVKVIHKLITYQPLKPFRQYTGRMLISRKSERPVGEPHLGKCKTSDVFQAEGNVEVVIEKLNKWVITERMWGRNILKNSSENPSAPPSLYSY
jgi:hypothetical protein